MRLRLQPTLVVSLSVMLVVAVGLVIVLQFISGRALISSMGAKIIERDLKSMELAFERYVNDTQHHATTIARQVGGDASMITDHARLEELLRGLFAAEPHLEKVLLLSSGLEGFRVVRSAADDRPVIAWLTPADISILYRRIMTIDGPSTTPLRSAPQFDPASGRTVTTVVRWLVVYGRPRLLVEIGTAVEPLSALALTASSDSKVMYFVLLGDNKVLAHPLLAGGPVGNGRETPLIDTQTLGDGVLAAIDQAEPVDLIDISSVSGASLGKVDWRGTTYLVVTQQLLHEFGGERVTVGAYRPANEVRAPLEHFMRSMWLAIAVLVVALAGAMMMGRMIARPVRRVSGTAAKIGRVDFDAVEEVPGSIIAELDELARSINAMVASLKLFGRYVPRSLVARLIGQSGPRAGTEEREMSVMFTDIAGFTRLSEGMSAREVAQFINHHLTLLGECVEAEGGTIDKYVGDALMAFWGAPEPINDHAEAACRAALAIMAAIHADNLKRKGKGLEPVRVRIGIHTGPLVVGDIGSPSRINYTVIGDTVNTAARLESQGKSVDAEAETITLISGAVRRWLPSGWRTAALGRHSLRGRSERIEMYRLLAAPAGTQDKP